MATFPDIKPTYGTRKNNKPIVKTVRFADGYEHRIPFGLITNQNPKEFDFEFAVSESEADTIEAFLDARGGTESFDYTPKGESAMKFVCEDWTKEIPYNNRGFIKATFRQVFEP